MNFQFEVNVNMQIDVTNVNSAEHAVNRLRKYLRTAYVEVRTFSREYTPDGEISLSFNELDIVDTVDTDDIINPPSWFSASEKDSLIKASEEWSGVSARTHAKLVELLRKEE